MRMKVPGTQTIQGMKVPGDKKIGAKVPGPKFLATNCPIINIMMQS